MDISALVSFAFRHVSTAYPDHSCRGSKIGDMVIRSTSEIIILDLGKGACTSTTENVRAIIRPEFELRGWSLKQWDIHYPISPTPTSREPIPILHFLYRYSIDNRFDARPDGYLIENDKSDKECWQSERNGSFCSFATLYSLFDISQCTRLMNCGLTHWLAARDQYAGSWGSVQVSVTPFGCTSPFSCSALRRVRELPWALPLHPTRRRSSLWYKSKEENA